MNKLKKEIITEFNKKFEPNQESMQIMVKWRDSAGSKNIMQASISDFEDFILSTIDRTYESIVESLELKEMPNGNEDKGRYDEQDAYWDIEGSNAIIRELKQTLSNWKESER